MPGAWSRSQGIGEGKGRQALEPLRTGRHLDFLLLYSVSFLPHSLLFSELTGMRDQAASCHTAGSWSSLLLFYLLFICGFFLFFLPFICQQCVNCQRPEEAKVLKDSQPTLEVCPVWIWEREGSAPGFHVPSFLPADAFLWNTEIIT